MRAGRQQFGPQQSWQVVVLMRHLATSLTLNLLGTSPTPISCDSWAGLFP